MAGRCQGCVKILRSDNGCMRMGRTSVGMKRGMAGRHPGMRRHQGHVRKRNIDMAGGIVTAMIWANCDWDARCRAGTF